MLEIVPLAYVTITIIGRVSPAARYRGEIVVVSVAVSLKKRGSAVLTKGGGGFQTASPLNDAATSESIAF